MASKATPRRALRRAAALLLFVAIAVVFARRVLRSRAQHGFTSSSWPSGRSSSPSVASLRGWAPREHKHGTSFGGGDPGDHGVAGSASIGAADPSSVGDEGNHVAAEAELDVTTSFSSVRREQLVASRGVEEVEGGSGDDEGTAEPSRPASPPPESPPPPESLVRSAKKTVKLVAGNAAMEVDHSTHGQDAKAAAAIVRAGREVRGDVDKLDKDKIVFASFVSNGFHEFMLNWFAHTQRLGIDNVIVAAFDDETEQLCREKGIPYHSDKDLRYTFDVMATGGQPLHDANAKVTMEGRAFQQIGALKAAFLLHLLTKGHRVLVSDVDTVWLEDPRAWFDGDDLPRRADVALSTDCLSHVEERRNHGCWHMQFNTGILWLRPTEPTKKLMGQWRDALLTTKVRLICTCG